MSKAELVNVENNQEQRAVAPITPMALIQRAQDSGASIEQMQQLFELQIRYEENEARKAYHKAIAEFKKEDIKIVKDSRVNFTSSKGTTDYMHETLGNVIAQVTEPMSRHGLSHSFDVRQNGNLITVTCRISHCLGHSEQVEMSAAPDQTGNKNSIQQIGSTVSYLQRYTLKSILGLASYDNDGQGGGGEKSGFMPQERFEAAYAQWKNIINTGKKTPAEIIAFVEGKGTKLSPEQIEIINNTEGWTE